jgi:hypothetical protein
MLCNLLCMTIEMLRSEGTAQLALNAASTLHHIGAAELLSGLGHVGQLSMGRKILD